jgi:hypothetical protein
MYTGFGHEWHYIQWVSLWFVLPCTGVLVVGVTSFREREHVPGLLSGGGGGFEWVLVVVSFFSSLHSLRFAPASPFIASKGRDWVTFAVKW